MERYPYAKTALEIIIIITLVGLVGIVGFFVASYIGKWILGSI